MKSGALLCLALFSPVVLLRAQPLTDAPVLNFRLPFFNEQGHRAWDLRAGEGQRVDENRIRLSTVNLRIYAGDAATTLRAEIATPTAIVDMNSQVVSGDELLEVVADKARMLGENWTVNGRERTVLIRRNVVVTFEGSLNLGGLVLREPASREHTVANTTIIHSDQLEARNTPTGGSYVFSGHVRLTGSDLEVTCGRLELVIENDRQGGSGAENSNTEMAIRKILATGDVVVLQEGRKAAAGRLELLPRESKAILQEQPMIEDVAANVTVSGSRMELFHREQFAIIDDAEVIGPVLRNFGPPQATAGESIPPRRSTIRSRRLEIRARESENLYTFSGAVHATATNLEMNCERLEAIAERIASSTSTAREDIFGGRSRIRRIVATGNVAIAQLNWKATAGRMEVLPDPGTAVLTETPEIADANAGVTVAGLRMEFSRDDQTGVVEQPVVIGPALPNLGLTQSERDAAAANPQNTRITSERLDMRNTGIQSHYVFSGSVRLTGTNLEVTCERIEAFADGLTPGDDNSGTPTANSTGQLRRILATGHVVIAQEGRQAVADELEILPLEEMAVLSGNITVVESGSGFTGSGDRATYRRGQPVHIERLRGVRDALPNARSPQENQVTPSPDSAP